MATKYSKNQILNFLDKASATMRKYLEFCMEYDDINTEYANMLIADLPQESLDSSDYADLVPQDVINAVTKMKTVGDAAVSAGIYVPAMQDMGKLANRR